MPTHDEYLASAQKQRSDRIKFLLEHSQALENGLAMPEILHIPRFLGVEWSGEDVVWAYFADDLTQIAESFNQSDTTGVSEYSAYDLDTDKKYVPVFQVERWIESE